MVPPSFDTSESVFDLSLIKQEEQALARRQQRPEAGDHDHGSTSAVISDAKGPLNDQCVSSEDSLPPLDSVTVDTAAPEDDSSVSTFGSVSSSSRRSMFSKYWAATGQVPVTIKKRSSFSFSPKKVQESQRRSIIFSPSSYGSFHSLPWVVETQPLSMDRKSVSVGDLSAGGSSHRSRGPLQSCLRRDPLYSGENPQGKSSSNCSLASFHSIHEEEDMTADDSSSVRFDLDATAVRHFSRPEEVHAEQGWSNYFH
jgi:hypothetical protein